MLMPTCGERKWGNIFHVYPPRKANTCIVNLRASICILRVDKLLWRQFRCCTVSRCYRVSFGDCGYTRVEKIYTKHIYKVFSASRQRSWGKAFSCCTTRVASALDYFQGLNGKNTASDIPFHSGMHIYAVMRARCDSTEQNATKDPFEDTLLIP